MNNRPRFLDGISDSYNLRKKNIVLLTGDTSGLFWSADIAGFVPLEQALYRHYKEKFNVLRVDMATGVGFYDRETEAEVVRVCANQYGFGVSETRDVARLIAENRFNPLPTLVLLRNIADAFRRSRELRNPLSVKPLCMLLQYTGALFPAGDSSRLSELDRQRLVFFLSWIDSPPFAGSSELVVLINPVLSEINAKIIGLPGASAIEIALPDDDERAHFVDVFTATHDHVRFESGKEMFVRTTAGLSLNRIQDLLEVASKTQKELTKTLIVSEVNAILQSQLGGIVRIKRPTHAPADIIGYAETRRIVADIFERCDDPETAVSAVLFCGPNGGGKTYQLEAYAAVSGRVVVELAGLRGSYFGDTDRFFELLRWHIATLGNVLILVDEAHTAFGSVHGRDTHETERRLAGNVIKMMGDTSLRGKVLWGLMTSRPDELDPDVKSRTPIQVPIFDLDGEERQEFVRELFLRGGITIDAHELAAVMRETDYYSARDYDNLAREVRARRRKDPLRTVTSILADWSASKSIRLQRRFQSLVAAQHCSYPLLLPKWIAEMEELNIVKEIEYLRVLL